MPIITVKLRNIIIAVSAVVLAVVLTAGVGATRASGIWLGRTPRRLPVYSAELTERTAALTFDVCTPDGDIARISEALRESGTPATFFVTGFWAERHGEKLQSLAEAGFEIGTHGNTHIDMAGLSRSVIGLELEASARSISAATGRAVELFRPPNGNYSDSLINAAEALGFLTLAGDVRVTGGNTPEQIAVRVLSNLRKGSIVVLRDDGDNSGNLVAALPLIIEGARNMGFTFSTAGEMIRG